ncbi:CDP-glycerol glycerophosphotransferase family protein [Terrisporobacter mayombei]|uniref:CDP-glycerol glycerophosphotransferase family protein n=1 Tax=Terrisporobacter mayombei TaxID=1541 RepID=UPI002659359F|nr:CDP-glycerol glycerophosphotransferase family protein [Terrisporobacter mayombei]MCC3671238.1 CDP-glycerol glycerophosphotransferase family protein [Terrisporobacter mayombei]
MKKLLKNILYTLITIILLFFRLFPIKKNKIIVINFSGKGYADNPKYIVEELLKNKNLDIVWASKKSAKESGTPNNVRVVKYRSLAYFYELATAKIWINNTRFEKYIIKRKEQFYLQTWHSPLRLKKIELDAIENLNETYRLAMKQDSKMISMMISGCDFSYNIYRNSFLYDGPIFKMGTPRCDVFFSEEYISKSASKFKRGYGIDENIDLILYAPTFRKNSEIKDVLMDIEYVSKNIPQNSKLLVRFHPSTKFKCEFNNAINVTDYPDMQELLCSADILITDYSSSMFDMLIANKKCILFAKDKEEYLKNERGIYFDFEKLPFPIVNNEEKLLDIINEFDEKKYYSQVEIFKNEIGLYEKGNASEQIADILTKIINDEEIGFNEKI